MVMKKIMIHINNSVCNIYLNTCSWYNTNSLLESIPTFICECLIQLMNTFTYSENLLCANLKQNLDMLEGSQGRARDLLPACIQTVANKTCFLKSSPTLKTYWRVWRLLRSWKWKGFCWLRSTEFDVPCRMC